MMTPLQDAAVAYRTERSRYWVRRRKAGEHAVPGGVTAIMVTEVDLEDGTRVYTGPEDDAKAWLDQVCLKAALNQLCENGSLRAELGEQRLDALRRVIGSD